MPAAATETVLPAPREPVTESVPALTDTVPVGVLTAESVCVPVPVFVNEIVPEMAPPKVALLVVPIVSVETPVEFVMFPVPLIPPSVALKPLASRVAPLSTEVPPVVEEVREIKLRMPPLTVPFAMTTALAAVELLALPPRVSVVPLAGESVSVLAPTATALIVKAPAVTPMVALPFNVMEPLKVFIPLKLRRAPLEEMPEPTN
jgi:hypothetical protein